MQTMIEAMITNYKNQVPELSSDYLRSIQSAFNYDSLLTQIIPIYTRHFTLAEINGLIAFYKTPLGKKMIQETPQIFKECMELGSKWGAEAGQKALRQYNEKQTGSSEERMPPIVEDY